MKQVIFKKVSIMNFLSVGDVPVDIEFNRGLNVITGVNKDRLDRRNGVGKSTVADAIHFALYGDTLRELKKEHIVNNITKSKCQVVLDFDIIESDGVVSQYKIIRKLVPTKCFLFKDDVDITRDSISNTTQYIMSLINSTSEVFQNCIIMTANNTTPFMAKKKIEKRKFIEGILNLQVFSNMLQDVRTQYNEISKNFDIECMRYEEVSKSVESLDQQLVDHARVFKNNIKILQQRRKENDRSLARLREQLNKESSQQDIDDLQTQLVDYKNKLSVCNDKMVEGRMSLAKLKTQLGYEQTELTKVQKRLDEKVCPACNRAYTEEDNCNHKSTIQQTEKSIQSINKEIESVSIEKYSELKPLLEGKIDNINTSIDQVKTSHAKIQGLENEVNRIKEHNKQIDDDLNQDDNVGDQLRLKLESTASRLNELQTNIDEIKKQLSRLDVIKYIVSEEGVKSYIVKKILQVLNNKLAYYLKKMDANCICVFDEYFEEQIFDEKGQLCSYFNYSGAERKNIDLACLFAFMDIRRLQGDVVFNFNIYDELLDSSLDEKGIEIVLDIIRERVEKYNEMVYVITHRKESDTYARGDVIVLQKEKGITTRVDNL